MTKIIVCTCKHSFQDAHYGKQKRVFNSCHVAAGAALKGWRCTVCNFTTDRGLNYPNV